MHERFVDGPIDPLSVLFEPTAADYDFYLREGEWGKNQEEHSEAWAEHYDRMNTIIAKRILQVSQEKGLPLNAMNVGLVGPGFQPVGHDISRQTANVILSELHRVIVIDFSLNAVRSAVQNLIQNGLSPDRVFGMQFDLTRGLSTMFRNRIQAILGNVETEQEFSEAAMKFFSQVTVDSLQPQLGEELKNVADNPVRMPGNVVGAKSAGNLRIKVNEGEPVPLHFTVLPMVLAGTNAATESHLYERWREVTSDESRGALPPSARRDRARSDVYRKIHEMVAANNSELAARAVARILHDNTTPDNQQPVICAITDISTSFNDPNYGIMPRLHPDKFSWRVGEMGGMAVISHPHVFKEAPDHEHIVAEVRVTRSPESVEQDGRLGFRQATSAT